VISPELSASGINYYETPPPVRQKVGADVPFVVPAEGAAYILAGSAGSMPEASLPFNSQSQSQGDAAAAGKDVGVVQGSCGGLLQKEGSLSAAAMALAAQFGMGQHAASAHHQPDRVGPTVTGSLLPDESSDDDDADSSDRLSSSCSCEEVEFAVDAASRPLAGISAAPAGLSCSGHSSTLLNDQQLPYAGPPAGPGQLPRQRQSWLDDLVEKVQAVDECGDDGSASDPSGWTWADGWHGSQDVLRLRGGGNFEDDDYSDGSHDAASGGIMGRECLQPCQQGAGQAGHRWPQSTTAGRRITDNSTACGAAGYAGQLAASMGGTGDLMLGHEAAAAVDIAYGKGCIRNSCCIWLPPNQPAADGAAAADDDEEEEEEDSDCIAAGGVMLLRLPPPGCFSSGGSYLLALHTSGKLGSGAITRVSRT
jgi:hypothetical protein